MKLYLVFILALAYAAASNLSVHKLQQRETLEYIEKPDGRIINGTVASYGQFPYQAGLSMTKNTVNFWCGGSLISSRWVLTAAHCTDGVLMGIVYLGSTIRTVALYTNFVMFYNMHTHADYDSQTLANDIALIKITRVSLNRFIQPIRLPSTPSTTYEGITAIASGWGQTTDLSTGSTNLYYTMLNVISNIDCAAYFAVNYNHKCVSTQESSSTCHGDSGGPLATDVELIGITSSGSATGCENGFPAVFTRVTQYLNWIQGMTGIRV